MDCKNTLIMSTSLFKWLVWKICRFWAAYGQKPPDLGLQEYRSHEFTYLLSEKSDPQQKERPGTFAYLPKICQ